MRACSAALPPCCAESLRLSAGCRRAKLCGLRRLGIRRFWVFAAQEPQTLGNRSALHLLHLADLNRGLGVCIVRNIVLKFLCMRTEGPLKCFHGLEQKMSQGYKRCRRPRLFPSDALLHNNAL